MPKPTTPYEPAQHFAAQAEMVAGVVDAGSRDLPKCGTIPSRAARCWTPSDGGSPRVPRSEPCNEQPDPAAPSPRAGGTIPGEIAERNGRQLAVGCDGCRVPPISDPVRRVPSSGTGSPGSAAPGWRSRPALRPEDLGDRSGCPLISENRCERLSEPRTRRTRRVSRTFRQTPESREP